MSHTRIHNIWLSMRQRCEKPKCSGYWKYGAKGIRVCDEWQNFENFRNWAFENGYNEHLTLDRIDPKGNYEPSNCRWATQKVQQNNRSNNVFIAYNGETKRIEDWVKETGLSRQTIYDRYKRGWEPERIFTQKKRKSPTYNKETIKPAEQSILIRFTDETDVRSAIRCLNDLKDTDFDGIEPYGKNSGITVTIDNNGSKKEALLYRNPTGYVLDIRRKEKE